MPAGSFSRSLSVSSDPEKTWATLVDVPQLVGWITVVEDARELVPLESYSAVLMDRIGPFKLRADLDIRMLDVRAGEHLAISVAGEDRQVGSRVTVAATLDLVPGETGGCRVQIDGSYEVTGKVASMGTGTIRKKADKVLDEFFDRAGESLGVG